MWCPSLPTVGKLSVLVRNRSPVDRGVSEVLGEALMIAVAVVLAGVVAFMVFNVNVAEPETPMVTLEFTQYPSGPAEYNVTVLHVSGDQLPADEVAVKIDDNSGDGDDSGNFSNTMVAGDSQVIATNVEAGDIVRLIWHNPSDSSTQIVGEYTVE